MNRMESSTIYDKNISLIKKLRIKCNLFLYFYRTAPRVS